MISILPLVSSLPVRLFGTVPRAPITTCITVTFMFHNFFIFWQDTGNFLFFRLLLFLPCNPLDDKFNCRFVILARIRWFICLSKSRRILYFLGYILVCANTICLRGQILIYCTILSGLPFPPSNFLFCIPFVPVGCVCIFLDKPFVFAAVSSAVWIKMGPNQRAKKLWSI